MPILFTKVYINDELEIEIENYQVDYEVTSTGILFSYAGSTSDWIYEGTGTFLGFSTTQGATTPDENLAVGDQYGFAVGNEYYLYVVEATQTTGKMYLGTSTISKMYIGQAEVSKVYLGQDLVYEKQASLPTFSGKNRYSNIYGPYQFEQGMTFAQWVASAYNTDGWVVASGGRIVLGGFQYFMREDTSYVSSSDLVEAKEYVVYVDN